MIVMIYQLIVIQIKVEVRMAALVPLWRAVGSDSEMDDSVRRRRRARLIAPFRNTSKDTHRRSRRRLQSEVSRHMHRHVSTIDTDDPVESFF